MKELLDSVSLNLQSILSRIKTFNIILDKIEYDLKKTDISTLDIKDKLTFYEQLLNHQNSLIEGANDASKIQNSLSLEELKLVYFFRSLTQTSQKQLLASLGEAIYDR